MGSKVPYQCVGFKQLILEALLEAPEKMLPLKELYAVLEKKEPSLCERKSDWKGTVRHILSAMPNFARVPDHAVRGVWTVSNVRMAFETPESEPEERRQEEEQDEEPYDAESPPSITVPSQWGHTDARQTYMQSNFNEYTTYVPFQRNYQNDGRENYEPIPMPPMAFAQNSNPMPYPCGSQTEWMPLQDILVQYPDLFRNLPLKQTI